MTIEIHAGNKKVNEKTITGIRKKLIALSRLGERISRAEVYLADEPRIKTCKITLSLPGSTLFVSKQETGFEKAAGDAIKTLRRILKKSTGEAKVNPQEIVSSVNV